MEPGAAFDSVLSTMRRGAGAYSEAPPADGVLGRFMVTKASWRGRYRRVLVVTRSAVLTLHPEDGSVTNAWQVSLAPQITDLALYTACCRTARRRA